MPIFWVSKILLNFFFSPAYGEQLLDEDAMLLFSLYDHDVITCNDFGGEAFFPLKDVPGVTPRGRPTVGNFHGLKQMELALMFQENTGIDPFQKTQCTISLNLELTWLIQ